MDIKYCYFLIYAVRQSIVADKFWLEFFLSSFTADIYLVIFMYFCQEENSSTKINEMTLKEGDEKSSS